MSQEAISFLIEVDPSGGQTPFNILPQEWHNTSHYIEMASILPSSPKDLSSGWVRPRHMWGLTPTINYYSKGIVDDLLDTKRFVARTKIIVASSEFSKKLISSISTRDGPSIVLTFNKQFLRCFKDNEYVHVSTLENKTWSELASEIYDILINLLKKRGKTTFTGEKVTKRFHRGFLPKKAFLPRVEVGPNYLCRANEIVCSQTRGRIPEFVSNDRLRKMSNIDCYSRNCEIATEILCEKILDLLLATALLDKYPPQIDQHLKNRILRFIKNSDSLSSKDRKADYYSLKREVKSVLASLGSPKEITILMPTVNDLSEHYLLEHLRKTHGVEYEQELRDIVQNILEGGRRFGFAFYHKDAEKLVRIAEEVGNTRRGENFFLTALTALYASRKLCPVLKATTAPSSIFFEIRLLREKMSSGLSGSNGIESATIGEDLGEIKRKMNQCFPPQYHDFLKEISPYRLTIVSDLPFELIDHIGDTVLCQCYSTTRIPITPLYCMPNFYNHSASGPAIRIRFRPEDVLVVNSIPESDRAHREYEIFESTCRHVGLSMKFKHVERSEAFIELINSHQPEIVAYFGHASYDYRSDKVQLEFEEDRLTYEGLVDIQGLPKIFFGIGCETGSSAAFSGGLASHLLGLGVKAILATLFPIPADHAATFLGRTLAFVEDTKMGEHTLADFVYTARKLGWLNDNLCALEKNGVLDTYGKMAVMKEVSDILMAQTKEDGKSPKIFRAIPALEAILEDHGILESWRSLKDRIVPYSLFFTLLGSSHDLYLSH